MNGGICSLVIGRMRKICIYAHSPFRLQNHRRWRICLFFFLLPFLRSRLGSNLLEMKFKQKGGAVGGQCDASGVADRLCFPRGVGSGISGERSYEKPPPLLPGPSKAAKVALDRLQVSAMWLYLAVLVGLYFLRRWYRERQRVEKLTEKYVFITGCDSGFGNQLARQLDTRGLRVLAACLTEKGAQELERLTSDRLKTTLLDVTCTDSVAAATKWVNSCVGNKGLWGLVNNAGKGIPIAINEWLTKEDFAKLLDVNLLGLIDVTLQMLPLVRRAKGRVVNVSSVMGRLACFGGGYCLSKYGVEAFSDTLRREMSPFGVKVSIIEPGAFSTSILQSTLESFQASWNKALSETKEVYGQLYFENFLKFFQNLRENSNQNLFLVTDCIEHALTSRYPRARYSGGLDAKLFYLPMSYLPSSIADFIVTYTWPKPAQVMSG